MRSSCAALLVILGLAAPAAAQTPYLVRDINQVSDNHGSYPEFLSVLDGVAFFSAFSTADLERELWRTDGTESGTWQVADLCPGECSSFPRAMITTPAGFFFAASDGSAIRLWITRGDPASTFQLTEGATHFVFTFPRPIWDDRRQLLFFIARDPHGDEIWRSDGTAAGTYRVTDVHPRFEGFSPAELTLLNGELFFWGHNGRRAGLWATDGTPRGTRLVKSFSPSSRGIGGPTDLQVVGRTLVFLETIPSRGIGLWKSDGTARGTVPLAALGVRDTVEVSSVLTLGPRLYFTLSDGPDASSSLWVTNGTAKGTRKLGSFAPESAFLARTSLGAKVFFQAADPAHGLELWITDGTPKGTRLFKDLCPGPCSSAAYPYLLFRNRLVLYASTPDQGREIWTTNGTPAGTRLLRDTCPGSCDGPAGLLGIRNGRLFFFVRGETSREIWSSDGTSRGTSLVHRFGPEEVFPGGSSAVLPTGFLFIIFDPVYGQEPWHSDGTTAGTHVLSDIVTSVGNSTPQRLMRLGNEVFFFASDGIHGSELWKSDGTGEGTRLVAELTPGREPGHAPSLYKHAVAGGRLFFFLNSGLWRTDGTQAGTLRITPEGLRFGSELTAVGDRVFFNAGDAEDEIWVSDGTVEGTRKIGDGFGQPQRFVSFQERLYFSTAGQIWTSDGTPEGTGLLPATEAFEGLRLPTVYKDSLFFFASNYENQRNELWRTDGSPAGTALVTEVEIDPDNLVSTGERLFFSGYFPSQDELWVSDGTAAGTRKIANDLQIRGTFTIFRGGLYVWTGNDLLWRSDGTAEGTGVIELQADGIPIRGPLVAFGENLYTFGGGGLVETDGTPEGTRLLRAGSPQGLLGPELVPTGAHLFFPFFEEETGLELWALPAPPGGQGSGATASSL